MRTRVTKRVKVFESLKYLIPYSILKSLNNHHFNRKTSIDNRLQSIKKVLRIENQNEEQLKRH